VRFRPIFPTAALLVMALVMTANVYSQDADSARSFLESVYRHYGKGSKGIDFTGHGASRYFHSSLIALMRADEKANGPDSVGVLDGDPICSCQDWDRIRNLKIDVHMQSQKLARADVSFTLFDTKPISGHDGSVLKITLASENSAWRIYDIVDVSDPKAPFDLRNALRKEIQELTHDSNSKPGH
jgi:hypothetical protein